MAAARLACQRTAVVVVADRNGREDSCRATRPDSTFAAAVRLGKAAAEAEAKVDTCTVVRQTPEDRSAWVVAAAARKAAWEILAVVDESDRAVRGEAEILQQRILD